MIRLASAAHSFYVAGDMRTETWEKRGHVVGKERAGSGTPKLAELGEIEENFAILYYILLQ